MKAGSDVSFTANLSRLIAARYMNLRHSRSNKLAGRFAMAVLFIALATGCCAFFRISRPADIEAYFGMAAECHPVWKQFALRRFAAGHSAAELLRDFPPSDREEFGPYGVYSYDRTARRPGVIQFTAFGVVTRDGKLLSAGAGGCTWQYTFFDAHDAEFESQYAAFNKEKSKRRLRDNPERLEEKK